LGTQDLADAVKRLYRYDLANVDPDKALEHIKRALEVNPYSPQPWLEMAAVLDEPTGTVKWRTAEALSRLRALLGEEAPDHAPRTTPERGPLS